MAKPRPGLDRRASAKTARRPIEADARRLRDTARLPGIGSLQSKAWRSVTAAALAYSRHHFQRSEQLDGAELELAISGLQSALSGSRRLRDLVRRADVTLRQVREMLEVVVALYGAFASQAFGRTNSVKTEEIRRRLAVLLEAAEILSDPAQPAGLDLDPRATRFARVAVGRYHGALGLAERRSDGGATIGVGRAFFEHLERIFEAQFGFASAGGDPELRDIATDLLRDFGFAEVADGLSNVLRQRAFHARKRTTAWRCNQCSSKAKRDVLHAPNEPCPESTRTTAAPL